MFLNQKVNFIPSLVLLFTFCSQGLVAQEPVIRNVGAYEGFLRPGAFFYTAYESFLNEDVNRDGDLDDSIFHALDLETGEIHNLRLATKGSGRSNFTHSIMRPGFNPDFGWEWDNWIKFEVHEDFQGEDLNGDGEKNSLVTFLYNFKTKKIYSLGYSFQGGFKNAFKHNFCFNASGKPLEGDLSILEEIESGAHIRIFNYQREKVYSVRQGVVVSASNDYVLMQTKETKDFPLGDLNGDGDTKDYVYRYLDLNSDSIINLKTTYVAPLATVDGFISYSQIESQIGTDLNQDGDLEDEVNFIRNLNSNEVYQFPFEGVATLKSHGRGFLRAIEAAQGVDLNGDGDTLDEVLHLFSIPDIELLNLKLASANILSFEEDYVLFTVSENGEGKDLNEDGDFADEVVHLFTFSDSQLLNLKLASKLNSGQFPFEREGFLFFPVQESDQSKDLNDDSDLEDEITFVINLNTNEIKNIKVLARSNTNVILNQIFITVTEKHLGEDFNNDGDDEDSILHQYSFERDVLRSLGITRFTPLAEMNNSLLVSLKEAAKNEDINNDGDLKDQFLYELNLLTGEFKNLQLSVVRWGVFDSWDWVQLIVDEGNTGRDLNGDGDQLDLVVHFYNQVTREILNSTWASNSIYKLNDEFVLFTVNEWSQGSDLDGDGDLLDTIPVLYSIDNKTSKALKYPNSYFGYFDSARFSNESWKMLIQSERSSEGDIDLNFDGDIEDFFTILISAETGEAFSLPNDTEYSYNPFFKIYKDYVLIKRSESGFQTDYNNDGDFEDTSLQLLDLRRISELKNSFIRGDCTDDGRFDISDSIRALNYLFTGNGVPPCKDACDTNDDGFIDISDAVFSLSFMFLGQGEIPQPGFEICGLDPTFDLLDCEAPIACREG